MTIDDEQSEEQLPSKSQLKRESEALQKIGEELADVFIYTVLTAQHFELNIIAYIIEKLDKIAERRKK